ncbi:hypothetical protein C8Q72DRAFT_868840 [Fomitopsis betulina]|nr:hypothetical protein C8Q72DRAFT_868840 [Fomitopsis betulina]
MLPTWTEIKDAPTTYTSDAIILPMTILVHIFGFLRDQPVQRYRCRLVCHEWYHAIGDPETIVRIASEEDVGETVQIMMSEENRRVGRVIQRMIVHDDPVKPFAHCLPLRLRGEHFIQLRDLELKNLDWTATRPHPLFFRRISYFFRVKKLGLGRCRFHCADDLWNLLSALPTLKMLNIDAVTVELDLFGRHTSKRIPRLRELKLTCKVLRRSIIDVVSLLSRQVTVLDIRLDGFRTLDDFRHLICALPALDTARIRRDPPWEIPTASTTATTWTTIQLSAMSHRTALWLLTSFQPRALLKLAVLLRGAPSPLANSLLPSPLANSLLPSPSNPLANSLLQHSGPTLLSFTWRDSTYGPLEDPEVSVHMAWEQHGSLLC